MNERGVSVTLPSQEKDVAAGAVTSNSGTGPTPRSLTIGGSEAAAACGLDPHRSRVQLWLEKTGRVERPEAGEAAKWGTLLEPVVVEQVRASGVDVSPAVVAIADVADLPFMHGHPDRFFDVAGEKGVLEVKTTGLYRGKEWDDGIPAQPLLQVQHYLALTGLRLGLVACLIGGQRLVVRRCDRDAQIIGHMLRLEEELVGMVERDEPPAPVAADADLMGSLYPDARAGIVALTEEDYALALEYKARKKQLKAVTAQADEIKAKLCARLGEYQVGVYEGRPLVRWSQVTAEYPAREAETKVYRRFTVA